MDKTKFTELFDNSLTARALDVFLCGREYDYAMTDISRTTGINRQRLANILESLEAKGIIYKTRKLSGMQLYKINAKNEVAQALLNVYDTIIAVTS